MKAGDTLLSRDPASGKIEAKRVESVSKTISHALVSAELADPKSGKVVETITGTPNHPIYMEGRGWVALGELGIGTSVVTRAGPKSGGTGKFGSVKSASASSGTLVVKSTHWKAHPEGVAVYNFIVEGFHTYFVGGKEGDKDSGGVWVHNGPPCPGDPLYVGTYGSARNGLVRTRRTRYMTPHHAPQDAVSGTTHSRGITITIPKAVHANLQTTGRPPRQLTTIREHLAADVKELRIRLREYGFTRDEVNEALSKLIRENGF